MTKFLKYKLDNDFQLLLIPKQNIKHVAVSFTFDVGYFDEEINQKGYSHFLEHLINRFLNNNTKLLELKNKGSYFYSNASTNNFRTTYYLYSHKENVIDLIEALFDIFNIEYIDPKYFKKEKGAIIVEMKNILSKSEKLIFYTYIPEMMFGKKSKLIEDPIDHIKTIHNSSHCEIFNFLKKNYTKNNCVLNICGDFDKKTILDYVKKKNKIITTNKLPRNRKIIIPKIQKPKYIFVNVDIKKISNIYLNFFCCNLHNNKKIGILTLLKLILAGLNDSSILFDRLRTKLGIAYSPKVNIDLESFYGIFLINYDIENNNFKKSFEELIVILNELKTGEILTEELLLLAKNKYLYGIQKKLNDQNPENFLKYSNHILNKDFPIYDTKTFFDKFIKNVTINDLKKISREMFKKNNSYLCAIGTKKYDSKIVYNNLNKLS